MSHSINPALKFDEASLRRICRRWSITELALFGSAVRPDFNDQSDVDVMATFAPDSGITLWELADIRSDLEALFGRPVDVVTRSVMNNPYRRDSIERDLTVVYAA